MWLVVIAAPFFFLGMAVRSWRAPVYTLGIWLGLLALWLILAALSGDFVSESDAGGGGLDIDLFPDGDALLVLGAVIVGVTMVASYLGAIAGVLLAPKRDALETQQPDGDSA